MSVRLVALTVFAGVLGAQPVLAQPAACPAERNPVDIGGSSDPATRIEQRDLLITSLKSPNTIVRLGPDVDFDFTNVETDPLLGFAGTPLNVLPIRLGRCVTLKSAAYFENSTAARFDGTRLADGRGNVSGLANEHRPPPPPSARNARSPGPVLRYGEHTDSAGKPFADAGSRGAFFEANCGGGFDGEGARISGFRLSGPSPDNQSTDLTGIRVADCLDVEISNMEIAGWGGSAVEVQHASAGSAIPDHDPDEISVLIHDNYIHNNQHASEGDTLGIFGGHAEGYGVDTDKAGWSRIYNNVFDNNRHSVAADGDAGGYRAEHNLVLKGGGYHGKIAHQYIHVFDVHGSDNCFPSAGTTYNCGDAGRTFWMLENTFQYTKATDIHIRGTPKNAATIQGNIFALPDQDAAIDLYNPYRVQLRGNVYGADTFGKYGVCDFDGDGVDDLFLASGVTWWFSSAGQYQWTFLRADGDQRQNLRFGYFDGDLRCDVLTEHPSGTGQWFISSGGTGDWKPLGDSPVGQFGHPLSEVRFGRFERDPRVLATRRTTHAFWRSPDGQWFVTGLVHPNWRLIGGSGFALDQLAFGDFTGDGVTDILAVENGHWSISPSGTGAWRTLNPTLHDPVQNLVIANMDADDSIDDVLLLDRHEQKIDRQPGDSVQYVRVDMTWWRSKNGAEPWKVWKTYTMTYREADPEYVPVYFGFAGRFSNTPGAATMVIDEKRTGRFYSAAKAALGAPTEWTSLFPY